MTIERKDRFFIFADIHVGGFFELEGCVFIKVKDSEDELNAFNCTDEELGVVRFCSYVTPLTGKVVIE